LGAFRPLLALGALSSGRTICASRALRTNLAGVAFSPLWACRALDIGACNGGHSGLTGRPGQLPGLTDGGLVIAAVLSSGAGDSGHRSNVSNAQFRHAV